MGSSASGDARRVNTSGWDRVFASLLSISVTLFVFLLLLNFLIRSFAIFGLKRM